MNILYRKTTLLILIISVSTVSVFLSCQKKNPTSIVLNSIVESMTLDEKSSQVLMTGIYGKEVFSPFLYRYFKNVVPGAVLLFKYNIASTPIDVFNYVQSCNSGFSSLDSSIPVLFAIDHEGGDVYRMGNVTSRLPSSESVASQLNPSQSELLYESSGRQLKNLGICMNLAPVLETRNSLNTDFLGTRAFSDSPKIVQVYVKAAIKGYRKSGVLTVLKHFPGNGQNDPHAGLPILEVSKSEFEKQYVKPFRLIMKENPDSVLVSHTIVPIIDPETPFCLSYTGVTGILRKSLGFKGLIITDDISMTAISKKGYSSQDAAIQALKAGCDMIMTSDSDIRSIAQAISSEAQINPAFNVRLNDAVYHVLEAKYKAGLVKSPGSRYTDTRIKDFFNQSDYSAARSSADRILEEVHDK